MATITLRVGRNNPLTNQEVDDNFTNLNTDVGTRLLASNFTGANILTKLLDVDIDTSSLNASTLQGASPDTANTASTIVKRNASGNFSAGTITATLTGNVTGALTGNADTVTNGVVTTGSYSNPSWISSLAGSKITSIPNSSITNNSITINGTAISLGGSIDIRSTANIFTASQTFTDNAFSIRNVTTDTKIVQFNVGTVVGTKTLTIPNADGTIATQAYVTSASVSSATNLAGGRCLLQDGTVLLPALAFNSDQDTGLYWGGAGGSIFFTANGVKSGQIVSGGDLTMVGNVTAYSDARLKENVVTVEDALSKVSKLRGVFYNKIADESKTRKLGVIAQEIQPILPEVVITDAEGIMSVDYGNIVGLLIEAIKELQAEVQALKEAK